MKISIVGLYCDFNDPHLIEMGISNIESILKFAPQESEIIIITNDASEKFVEKLNELSSIEKAIIVSTNRNLGNNAKNIGYEIAQGEYVFSIDHDVMIRNGRAFTKCVDFLDLHKKTAMVGPAGGNLSLPRWSDTQWGVGAWDKEKNIFGYDDPADFDGKEELDGTRVDTISGMFSCWRKKVLREIGLLDWSLVFQHSDSDLCFRAKEAGYDIRIVRVPVSHVNKGACSHGKINNLQKINEDSVRTIYERWHSKSHIFENYSPQETSPHFTGSGYELPRQNIRDLCKHISPIKKMVEIGSFAGASTIVFAEYAEEVITVDPYIGGYDSNDELSEERKLRIAERIFEKTTKNFTNIRQIKNLSVEAAFLFAEKSLDFIYLDGCHTYDCVYNDIKAWLSKTTNFFGGHDWNRNGVRRAVREILGEPMFFFEDGSWLFDLRRRCYLI